MKCITIKPFYEEPNHTLYQGHALEVLKSLPGESIDCVPTSPPYWGLRTYKTEPIIWDNHNECSHEWGDVLIHSKGHPGKLSTLVGTQTAQLSKDANSQGNFCLHCNAWKGELGLEPTFELYISHLIQIFNEVKRVLKKTGTLWVNIGDSYTSDGKKEMSSKIGSGIQADQRAKNKAYKESTASRNAKYYRNVNLPTKSLCLIPERFAISMVEAGWILRNDIIWYKSNPMPESVKDRFTGTYEHVYFFTKSKKYWFKQQFEQVAESTIGRSPVCFGGAKGREYSPAANDPNFRNGSEQWGRVYDYTQSSAAGRNKRDVWEINTQPYPEAHFATFPEKLCETPILSGCPSMICKKCGKAREKIYDAEGGSIGRSWHNHKDDLQIRQRADNEAKGGHGYTRLDKGYTDCGCNAGFEPGTVLDPFAGSGTALAVAKKLNRKSIGIELNPFYCQLVVNRLSEISMPMELGC